MATMYTNSTPAAQEKINFAAYDDEDSECPAGHDDDRSTHASSGGSEALSSGSEDESNLKTLNRITPTVTEPPWRAKKRSPPADKLAAGFQKQAAIEKRLVNVPTLTAPTLLEFPPGLEPVGFVSSVPPGLEQEFSAPPGLEHPSEVLPYTRKAFRKEMSAIFNDIRQARSASLHCAVQRVRAQNVPKEDQPSLFSEMMTRAIEEMSGPGRRLCMAFVAGVAAGSPSAFDKKTCLAGIKIFFHEVYDDLMDEVPKLQTRVEREFLPTLRTAFNVRELNDVLPVRLRAAP